MTRVLSLHRFGCVTAYLRIEESRRRGPSLLWKTARPVEVVARRDGTTSAGLDVFLPGDLEAARA